jgi:hypothetical protein
MPMTFVITAKSGSYPDFDVIPENILSGKNFINSLAFFPSGRANITTSASLQPIRGSSLQLHGPLPCRCSNLDS